MTIGEHVKSNLVTYLIFGAPLLASFLWWAHLTYMDGRHDAKGSAEMHHEKAEKSFEQKLNETELNRVRREIRQQKNYLELAPSEQYDPARKANLRELEDEETRLIEKSEKFKL